MLYFFIYSISQRKFLKFISFKLLIVRNCSYLVHLFSIIIPVQLKISMDITFFALLNYRKTIHYLGFHLPGDAIWPNISDEMI
jgi:hypothetical protein